MKVKNTSVGAAGVRSRRHKLGETEDDIRGTDSMPGAGVRVNLQGVLVALGIIAVIIYGLYTFLPRLASKHAFNHVKEHDTWKTAAFGPVDSDIWKNLKTVRTTEHNIEFTVGDEKVKVFYREALPSQDLPAAPPVVLIHGSGDSSKWWENIGTFGLGAAAGHRVIGLDLPGWGQTDTLSVKHRGKFLAAFLQEVKAVKPVLVAASLGGVYAIPYLMEPRGVSCLDRVSAFVPIATVGTEMYTPAQYHRCHVPTMIVYGTKDTKLGLSSVGDLRNLANNEIFPMEKAGHACVREKPEEWHTLLFNFLRQITEIPSKKDAS